MLMCECGAWVRNTSKERNRFNRRHGGNCLKAKRRQFSKQLAEGTKSVEPTTWEEHAALREEVGH